MAVIYYTESTPVCATSTVAASATTATITAPSGRMAYITGFIVNGLGATGASVIAVTVTGIQGGTQTYQYSVPAGATTLSPTMQINFPLPIPASAYGTNIVVNVPSFGAGNTNANVTVYGYLK